MMELLKIVRIVIELALFDRRRHPRRSRASFVPALFGQHPIHILDARDALRMLPCIMFLKPIAGVE
jgi:hypothetical protein